MRILVTGGSGYLGQFLVECLCKQLDVAFTYLENSISNVPAAVQGFRLNLATGDGVEEAILSFKPQIVINCAALSQPAACERDYEACRAVNVPKQLVGALQHLQQQHGTEALVIHISTDQVYDGSRPDWRESDPTRPVNAYGRSKLEAEQYLQQAWPGRYVILRASLIYGPDPPLQPVGRPLFVQFVEQVLAKQQLTNFFVDEYRSAVYVYDICIVVQHIIDRYAGCHQRSQQQQQPQQQPDPAAAAAVYGSQPGPCVSANLPHSVYNMGGPERLSRYDMAMAVAAHCGHSTAAVAAAQSADVQRGYNSPPDISMNMDQPLTDMPGIKLMPFAEGLQHIFP